MYLQTRARHCFGKALFKQSTTTEEGHNPRNAN